MSADQTLGPYHQSGTDRSAVEEELACLIQAQRGSRAAQAELVNRYMPVVYRLCLKLLGDPERASDATQEVFLRALGALGTFDRSRSFRAWICAIAWNHSRDQLRRARRRSELPLRPGGMEGDSDDRGFFEPADREDNSPVNRLERKERSALVEQALKGLEPTQRALVILCDVEGLSYGELAELFGCRLGTVKSRIHRARTELKNALRALDPDWFEAQSEA
ncbi:MAG: sigma-70 family RNA polymerase sigma factor [Planctomycetes bacterium]|nr:sigma-70 family RNA polymerase sigma factor [Planctomycetota bacterium]